MNRIVIKKVRSFDKALLFILIPLVLVGFSSFRLAWVQKTGVKSSLSLKPPISSLTPKPTPTPSPTPSPTPTPQPLIGYCLRVPVIFYHHIQPEADAIANKQSSLSVGTGYFEQQMAYLNSHGYTTVSALDLVNALRNHTKLSPKSIVVTIDDGYNDVYTNAFPIIKKYNIRVSLMIPTGLINNSGFATWGELKDMENSGLVYFVDHSWSHFYVRNDINKIHYEIETARSQLEQNLSQKVDLFAYPYGASTSLEVGVLQQDGFMGAFSTIPGTWECDSFIMNLHRIRIGNASLSYYGF